MVQKIQGKRKHYPCCTHPSQNRGFLRKGYGTSEQLCTKTYFVWGLTTGRRTEEFAARCRKQGDTVQQLIVDDGLVPIHRPDEIHNDRSVVVYSLSKRKRWTLLDTLQEIVEISSRDLMDEIGADVSVYCHQTFPNTCASTQRHSALSLSSTRFLKKNEPQPETCLQGRGTVYSRNARCPSSFKGLLDKGNQLYGQDVSRSGGIRDDEDELVYEIGIPWNYNEFYFGKQYHRRSHYCPGKKSLPKTKGSRNKVGEESYNYRFVPQGDYDESLDGGIFIPDDDADNDAGAENAIPPALMFCFIHIENYVSPHKQQQKKVSRRYVHDEREFDFCDYDSDFDFGDC